jgi:16S rRNA (adenine1518-N6/adenine1519-N6)-dimethyltransferase
MPAVSLEWERIRTMTHRMRPSKRLGQHFLRDPIIAFKIIESMDIGKEDYILEIGPGRGELTEILLNSPAERIVAVEIDHRLIHKLKERFGHEERLQIIEGDILNIDFSTYFARNKKTRIVGNLPYNITSPILFRLLDFREFISDMTIMVQKEVGDRLTSPPGMKAYGIPSVLFQVFCRIRTLFFVPSTAFFPVPKVDSSVLRFRFLDPIPFNISDVSFFKHIVKITFGQRRKMLRNTLKSVIHNEDLLNAVSIDLKKRPESLSISQFVQLSNELYQT